MNNTIRGLYGITIDGSTKLVDQAESALQGGASVIQYRDKNSSAAVRTHNGSLLKELCAQYSACFIVNDDLELALRLNANGLHIGKNDGDISHIKQRLGDKILGVSCYNNLDLAKAAERSGADYVAFGRFFNSQTKPGAVQAEIELLTQAKACLRVPVVAIGGITLNNAESLIKAGADSLAVIDGLFGQADIKTTAQQFIDLFATL